MAESLSTRINATGIGSMSKKELRILLAAMLNAMQAMAAKLDADSGVGDTDFAATVATYIED